MLSTEAKVMTIPPCDLCPKDAPQPAAYDSRTTFGPWANLCEEHWGQYGVGQLGTGYGQRLVQAG